MNTDNTDYTDNLNEHGWLQLHVFEHSTKNIY